MCNYVTGPTDRAWQVAYRMLLAQMVDKFLDLPLLSPAVRNELRGLVGKERWNEQPEVCTEEYVIPGVHVVQGLFEPREINALAEAGFVNIDVRHRVDRHGRISKNGVTYQSGTRRVVKYNNSIAHVNAEYNGRRIQFIDIVSIVI